MQNKNGLSGLRAAAAASFLTLLASCTDVDQNAENAANQDSGRIVFSEATQKNYGSQINIIAEYTPGLNALVLTQHDLGVDITKSDIDNINLYASCDQNLYPQTIEGTDSLIKLQNVQDYLYESLKSLTEGENPIIDPKDFQKALIERPRDFVEHIEAAAAMALTGTPAAISFKELFPDNPKLNFAIITMPANMNDSTPMLQGLSGLSVDYLENIKSTPSDIALMTLGHEIAGHAYNQHTPSDNSDYNCVTINGEHADATSMRESVSDIAGSNIYKKAQAANLTSPANAPEEFAALRALGNFYLPSNISTYSRTSHINGHLTTLMFDPKAKNSLSDMDMTQLSTVTTLPLTINRLADVISGLTSTIDFKKTLKENPKDYSADQHAYFKSLSVNPRNMEKNFDALAQQGLNIRLGTYDETGAEAIKANPQFHYAALAFIKKHDLLASARAEMGDEFAKATNDLLNDFLDAADLIAPKLKNPEITAKIENALKKEDFKFLTLDALIMIYDAPAPADPTIEAAPNTPQI